MEENNMTRKMVKKYLFRKKLFSIIFLTIIYGLAILNWISNKEIFIEAAENQEIGDFSNLENELNENLYAKMNFVEFYGLLQNIMGKKEFNNFSYVKDEGGFLQYASFFREPDDQVLEYALRVKRLQDKVESRGTKVFFVVPPGKYTNGHTLASGLPLNDPTPTVEQLLFYLNRLGIKTLNMNEYLPNSEISYDDLFFRTDHHWTIPGAFAGTKVFADFLKDNGLDLDPDNYYFNREYFTEATYKDIMLGSMGRTTGANFSGIEDFVALWPEYTGSYTREYWSETGSVFHVEGTFQESIMNTSYLTTQRSIYSDSMYSLYLDGLRVYEHIENNENPDGPSFFMIRDSYFSPVISFLMPTCGSIEAVWSLIDENVIDIDSYIDNNTYDYIVIEMYPYNIEDAAFNFCKEE